MVIDKETKLFGSFSQKPGNKGSKFFNGAFQRHSINAIYKSYFIEDIEKGVEAARTLDFKGFAVAMPFKKSILPFLDEVDSKAKAIGSVNTVVNLDGKFVGYNTDYLGVCKIFPILDKRETVVVGNGGLAASVIHCLEEREIEYSTITRTNWSMLRHLEDQTVINCTPVSLGELDMSNQLIDLNTGTPFGDLLHRLQAEAQFKLYTGIEYGS